MIVSPRNRSDHLDRVNMYPSSPAPCAVRPFFSSPSSPAPCAARLPLRVRPCATRTGTVCDFSSPCATRTRGTSRIMRISHNPFVDSIQFRLAELKRINKRCNGCIRTHVWHPSSPAPCAARPFFSSRTASQTRGTNRIMRN